MERKVARNVTGAVGTVNRALACTAAEIEQMKRIYGMRLLARGVLWMAVYGLSRWLLRSVEGDGLRVAIALAPTPFFVWFLWTYINGVGQMDELERRIELEALAFAFPAAIVFISMLGLLDVAITLDPRQFSLRNVWLLMPLLYYAGLYRAKRRYQ